ncbi:hypothetical protein [Actinomadura sp. 9N407]|uniref:hypothetical protein n=1 Tax=Actinomadura sp. 9N407 TaxID=3375154 RepID=UPI00379C08C7
MRHVQGDLELRPDFRAGMFVLTAFLVATVVIVAAILIGDAPTVFAPIVGLVFGGLILMGMGALLRARVILTPHEIVVKGLFFRRRESRSRVAELVRATIIVPRGAAGESLFVLDAHRNLLIRVSGGAYKREDFDRLVNALGVPCSGPDAAVPGKEFAKTYPGLLPWVERHPYRFAFAIAGGITAALLVVVLIAIATTS